MRIDRNGIRNAMQIERNEMECEANRVAVIFSNISPSISNKIDR
jgi:hypothetical protein